tara:strand:+ start:354 stop:773 length:420 start_codon:yes stop_codon:yes gene_type:complete
MSIVDSGKAQLTQPKPKEDKKRLREFLAGLDEKSPDDKSPNEMLWDCVEKHGYKRTKQVFESIEQSLIEESKSLIEELRQVLEKKANVKLKEHWYKFNKHMGEVPKIDWQSLPKKKTEKKESEHKAEDILSMIRKRQQN